MVKIIRDDGDDMFTARRKLQLTAGTAVLVAMLLLAACDWTQFRYGPEHTGFNPTESTIGPANVSGLRLRWSQSVGTPGPRLPMTVASGALYASTNGKLYAFDANTGSARWSKPYIGDPVSAAAVTNGVVYVSATNKGLYAFDATTGTTLWSSTVTGSPYVTGNPYIPPTVASGAVYVATTCDPWLCGSSLPGLEAFDATTGAKLWSFTGDDGGSIASPTVANGVVYMSTTSGLDALDATTGAKLWSKVTPYGYVDTPAVANGVVYVCTAELADPPQELQALDATTGAELWSAQNRPCRRAPAVANGVVYAGGSELDAYNAATGAKLWSSGSGPSDTGSPTVANGVVYVGGDRLYAYDAVSGAQLWSTPTTGREPVIANGVVYVGGNELHAYSLPVTGPQLSISPAFDRDFVFKQPDWESRVYTITNIGSTPTSAIADSLSGPDAAHFRLTADGCTGTSLAGRASCTVTASFAPTRGGSRTAWLAATATDGGTARAQLTGTAPLFTISPPQITFADRFPGTTSTASVFQVTNLTNGPVGPFTTGVISPGFAVADDGCAGKTIAAGTSCTIAVAFAPTEAQHYSGAFEADAPGRHVEAYLDGIGLSPLKIAPAPNASGVYDFGSVPVGTTASKTFTITNISPTPVGPITDAIGPFSVFGGPTPIDWFTTTADSCTGQTLATNDSCTFVVNFTPTNGASQVGALTITAPHAGTWLGLIGGSGLPA